MHQRETAKEFLRKRWAERRRTPFVDIRCFGLPLNEELSPACQFDERPEKEVTDADR